MAHIYMRFDFADEETAQLARHKLEVWKQAFRLDKKLLYKFERSNEDAEAEEPKSAAKEPETAKAKGKGKSDSAAAKSASKQESKDGGNVQLLVRLGFSGHEKITENRWVERIPTEEPFVAASPVTVKPNDTQFDETEKRFEDLE
jgi:chromatin remodeling complex protein RSC6